MGILSILTVPIVVGLTITLLCLYAKYRSLRDIYWYGLFFLFFPSLLFISRWSTPFAYGNNFNVQYNIYYFFDIISEILTILVSSFIISLPIAIIISLVSKSKRLVSKLKRGEISSLVSKSKREKTIEDSSNTEKYLKYAKPKKSFFDALLLFIVGFLFIFIVEFLFLLSDNTLGYRSSKIERDPDGVYDYPIETGDEAASLDSVFIIPWTVFLVIISVRIHYKKDKKKYKEDLKNARDQVDTMLVIEKLAGENNSNEVYRVAVQEMKNVAPSIIENMSADSRVYFDLVLEGKIPLDDPELMKSAAAIVRGHLKTHPEDKQLVTSAFGENHPILKDLAGTEKNS